MDNFWLINIEDYGLVRIKKTLMDQLAQFRQLASHHNESGGILIGKHINSGGRVVIEEFTPPQPSDMQSRCNYFRSSAHNELANQRWQESGGHSTYVGLWHTHPEPIPTPSQIDLKDWRDALRHSKYEGKWLFFFIVGQSHTRCWASKKTCFKSSIFLAGEYQHEG